MVAYGPSPSVATTSPIGHRRTLRANRSVSILPAIPYCRPSPRRRRRVFHTHGEAGQSGAGAGAASSGARRRRSRRPPGAAGALPCARGDNHLMRDHEAAVDAAPGWEAIDEAIAPLVEGVAPVHWGVSTMIPDQDGLWGVS